MKQAKELYNTLKDVFGKTDEVFPAVVKSVDIVNSTCDIEFDELEMGGVRLKATVGEGKAVRFFPAIGSLVLVQRLGEIEEYFVTMYSEVDEVVYEIGDCVFEIYHGFIISKGEDSLKDILKLMIEAVIKIIVLQGTNPDYIKLNQALNKVENLFK